MTERQVRNVGRQVYGRPQPLKPPRRQPKRSYTMGAMPWRLLVLAVVLGGGVVALVHMFTVKMVTVVGPVAQVAGVQTEATKLVAESWRQGNLLTFDTDTMASRLQQADPALRTVMVARSWPHSVKVTVTVRQPSLGWSSGNARYLLDHDGTAIGSFPDGSTLPVVNDGSNLPVTLGQRVAPTRFVTFVGDLVPALAAQKINVKALDIKGTTLDLTVTTDKGYQLIFDTSRTVADEMIDLRAVLTLLQSQKKTPAQYIDLRVAGKAYYQ